MVLYNLFKHNSQDANPNVLKQMSSPRPVSRVTCSGQISAEWWGKFREPRAAPSAVGGRRPPLSLLRNKQLIEESLEEYCVPVEMRKVLSFHTNQVKGLPWPLVDVLQRGMMVSRERRRFQRISDVQSRARELYLFLPPELQELASLACTHIFPQKRLRSGGTSPSLCTSSPSCDMLGCHFNLECIGCSS